MVRLVWLRCLFLALLVLTKTEVAERSVCSNTVLSFYVWAILVTQVVVDIDTNRKVNIEKYLSRQIIKSPMGPPIKTFQSPIKAFYGPISTCGTIWTSGNGRHGFVSRCCVDADSKALKCHLWYNVLFLFIQVFWHHI